VGWSPEREFYSGWVSLYSLKTNSSPLKIGNPQIKLVFQPSIFRGCISFREGKTFNEFSTPKKWGFNDPI